MQLAELSNQQGVTAVSLVALQRRARKGMNLRRVHQTHLMPLPVHKRGHRIAVAACRLQTDVQLHRAAFVQPAHQLSKARFGVGKAALIRVLVVQKRHLQRRLSDIYPQHRTRHVSLPSDNLVHPSSTHLRVASDIIRPVKGGTRQGIYLPTKLTRFAGGATSPGGFHRLNVYLDASPSIIQEGVLTRTDIGYLRTSGVLLTALETGLCEEDCLATQAVVRQEFRARW